MYEKIISGDAKIAVIGLGYVGLPIALEFAKHSHVIGFDIKPERIALMQNHIDPSKELPTEAFENTDILFTHDIEDLRKANFFIVAVPTPIDEFKQPDLKPLLAATTTVSKVLKEGDYVVFESTVYPGCTEEYCVPILESGSGLEFVKNFKVGFSPERINPGDKVHTLTKIVKVVSGCDAESLANISKVYQIIIEAGVHEASSIKVAEAAKIIENTQRDINIAFMNELSMIFDKMHINTYDVLEAARTKWNFLNFSPGLVGGHCIGVDPYYLSYKAKEYDIHAQIINAGRSINDNMGPYVSRQIVKKLLAAQKNLNQCKALVMGITFKENVSDIRNSKIIDLIDELQAFTVSVDIVDIRAAASEVEKEYHVTLKEKPADNYDVIILAVNHEEYSNLEEEYFKSISNINALFVDIKGIYRGKIKELKYWSL